eukprot:gene3998-528_t
MEFLTQRIEAYRHGYMHKKMPVPKVALAFFVDAHRRLEAQLRAQARTVRLHAASLRYKQTYRAIMNLEGAGHTHGGVEVTNLAQHGKTRRDGKHDRFRAEFWRSMPCIRLNMHNVERAIRRGKPAPSAGLRVVTEVGGGSYVDLRRDFTVGYGYRCKDRRVWELTPYEMLADWEIIPAEAPSLDAWADTPHVIALARP